MFISLCLYIFINELKYLLFLLINKFSINIYSFIFISWKDIDLISQKIYLHIYIWRSPFFCHFETTIINNQISRNTYYSKNENISKNSPKFSSLNYPSISKFLEAHISCIEYHFCLIIKTENLSLNYLISKQIKIIIRYQFEYYFNN